MVDGIETAQQLLELSSRNFANSSPFNQKYHSVCLVAIYRPWVLLIGYVIGWCDCVSQSRFKFARGCDPFARRIYLLAQAEHQS